MIFNNYTYLQDTEFCGKKEKVSVPVHVQESCFLSESKEDEFHILLNIKEPSMTFLVQLDALCRALKTIQHQHQAQMVFLRVFLSDAATQTDEVINYLMEDCSFPISIIEQPPANGTKLCFWAYLKTGVETRAIDGGFYEVKSNACRQLWMVGATAQALTSKEQTILILQHYALQLLKQGLTIKDNCIRTWFYVRDIDNQYAGMVEARNEFFAVQGLNPQTHFIASTGINGCSCQTKSYVNFDALAYENIKPEQIHYLYALRNMNRTCEYGVSFERGTAIDLGDRRQVFVSGTASIDSSGSIVCPNDIVGQTQRMLENIEAVLNEAECDLKDIQSAIVYLRDMADYSIVSEYLNKYLGETPFMIVHAPVCRPGWLIETECMAMRAIMP